MRKLVLSTLLVAFALPALAQTTTGPASCKATEKWDEATKTCKAK
jgi:hypothetical protein